jgi:hypothetical protein
MASRRLRNRSSSVVIQGDTSSDNRENMEYSNATYFESDAEVTVRENPALEQIEQNANTVVTSNDNLTICTDSSVDKGSMSATQLQELLSTLMHIVQCESCEQTAALVVTVDSNLTSAIENFISELRY